MNIFVHIYAYVLYEVYQIVDFHMAFQTSLMLTVPSVTPSSGL